MIRLVAAGVLVLALALAGVGARPSGADFVAASIAPANTFGAATDFNTVAVTLADPGTPLQGTRTLSACASSDRGIATVAFQRAPAGGGAWTTICTASTAPYDCSFDTTTTGDGSYDLRALATDSAGYTRTSVVAARVVDNLGPAVTLDDPGSYLQGSASLHASASDVVGLATLAIEYRTTGGSTWTQLCRGSSGSQTCSLNTIPRADGDVDLRAVATDTGGHTTTTATIVRRVDNVAPTTAMTDPGTMRGTVTLAATAADGTGTGVSSVAIRYRTSPGGPWVTACTKAAAPYTCSLNTTGLVDGDYDLQSVATDGAAHSTSSTVLTRKVDNTAPTATLTNPATLTGTVALSGTATDSGSGVATWVVHYRPAAGGAWVTACSDASSPYACTWDTTAVADGL